MSGSVGVERIFPVNLPALQKVEINKKGAVRRARIFYFRELTGKFVELEFSNLENLPVKKRKLETKEDSQLSNFYKNPGFFGIFFWLNPD